MVSVTVIPNRKILPRDTMRYADGYACPPMSFSGSQIEEEIGIFKKEMGDLVKGLPGVICYEFCWGLVHIIS